MDFLRLVARFLSQPWLFFLVLSGAGILNLWRRRIESRRRLLLATVPFGLLILLSTPAVNYLAVGSLEWAYQKRNVRPAGIEAIVVLGGYIMPPDESRDAELGLDSFFRCVHAVELYQMGPACPVVVAGGKVDLTEPGPPIAEVMAAFMREKGVAASDLILESNSRNTYENAKNTQELLAPRGIHKIAVVTHGVHLRRAEGCFRKQGFEVYPAGCSFHRRKFEWSLWTFLPDAMAAESMSSVMHEWIGIAVYRLQGWL